MASPANLIAILLFLAALVATINHRFIHLPRAIALVDYHVRRNEVARKSHTQTWKARHPDVKFLRL